MRDVIAAPDLRQGLTRLTSRKGLLALVRGKLELAPEPNASRLRSLAALSCPRQDQVSYKLRKSTKNRHH
jgi:hypothetical protein